MNSFFKYLLISLLAVNSAWGQLRYTYDFSNGLNGVEPGAPPLRILGTKGEIRDEPIKELKGNKKVAYFFEANSGLQFDNNLAKGFLDKSYSVEIYFSFNNLEDWRRVIDFKNRTSDNGCYILNGQVNFFNFAVGQNAAVRPKKYTHYIFTRDHKRNYIQIYVDGALKLEFPDKTKQSQLSNHQVLNFFQDDLVVNRESSEGSVAYIRVYDEVVDPIFVSKRFRNLLAHLRRDSSDEREPDEPSEEAKRAKDVVMSGRIYDGKDLKPLSGAEIKLKTPTDSLIAIAKLSSGDYMLNIRPETPYKLDIKVTGYKPRGILIDPIGVGETWRNNIRLEEEFFTEPIVVVPFEKSENSLVTEDWLQSVSEFLKSRPDLGVRIEGHSDNVGDFNENVKLSTARAEKVKEKLKELGTPESKIKIQGYGPVRPISNNLAEEGRKQNRRVEVWPAHL